MKGHYFEVEGAQSHMKDGEQAALSTLAGRELIVGWCRLRQALRASRKTILSWYEQDIFPLAILPDGRYFTTKMLLVDWLRAGGRPPRRRRRTA